MSDMRKACQGVHLKGMLPISRSFRPYVAVPSVRYSMLENLPYIPHIMVSEEIIS